MPILKAVIDTSVMVSVAFAVGGVAKQLRDMIADDLIFDNGKGVAAQKLDFDLLNRFEKISRLPQKEREAVETMLDGILIKNQLNDMIAKK